MVTHDKGSDHTDDDLVAGDHNWAEDPTILWAQKRPDSFFDGQAILIVEVAESAKDPDDYANDDGSVPLTFTPDTQLDGIIASGWSASSPGNAFGGIPGGVGVVGVGGRDQGTGVVGKGGGIKHDSESAGIGGIGVHGLGGSRPDPDSFPWPGPPGAGVVGQGGRWSPSENTGRQSHGAGVIGIGGGKGPKDDFLSQHPLAVTGGVGVYGQGAKQDIDDMALNPDVPEGPLVASGPAAPGNGVLARGGEPSDPAAPGAAGVVGVTTYYAGPSKEEVPPHYQTAGVGVFGSGDTGVYGLAPDRQARVSQGSVLIPGVGVRGQATDGAGRGGLFQSARSAQIRLEPIGLSRAYPTAKPTSPTHLPTAADEGSVAEFLPRDGQGGDLIALMDRFGESTLWFCALPAGAGPAQWAQVLLGPSFAGTA